MKDKVTVGVLGLGRMGMLYARHLASLPEARLVAVASRRAKVAQETAVACEAERWYDSYEALLADDEVQAVVIATATREHKEHIIQAAQAGKDIFCEKPIALTLEDTDAALQAVEAAGVKLQVGFMRRFDPAYVAAKRRIEEGAIGQPVTFKAVSRDPQWPAHEDDDPSTSGGIFLDMGIHDFDLARWLMESEVQRVYAEGCALVYPPLAEVGDIDNSVISLRFQNGAVGCVNLSRNARYGYDIRTEVLGSEGVIMIGTLQRTPVLVLTRDGMSHEAFPWFPERFEEAYRNEIAYFIACVREGRPPEVTGADGRAALAIALAARESYRTGQPVTVSGP